MDKDKEKEYQDYIDRLHFEKEELKITCENYRLIIADTENRLCKALDELEMCKKAIFNAFIKWGQTDAH